MKFRICVAKTKGADRSYCEADLRLCFRLGKNLIFSRCGSFNNVCILYLYPFVPKVFKFSWVKVADFSIRALSNSVITTLSGLGLTLKNCWFAVLLPTHKNWPYPKKIMAMLGKIFLFFFKIKDSVSGKYLNQNFQI